MTAVKSALVNINYCITHVLPQTLNTEEIWTRNNIKEIFRWGKYCENVERGVDKHLQQLAPLTLQPHKYCYEYVRRMCDHLLHGFLQNSSITDDRRDIVMEEYISICGRERYEICEVQFENVKDCYKSLMKQCMNNHKWDFLISSLTVNSLIISENEMKEKIVQIMNDPTLLTHFIHHLTKPHESNRLEKHFTSAVNDLHPYSASFWPFWTTLPNLELTDLTNICKNNQAFNSAFTTVLLQLGKCLLVLDDEILRTDGKPVPHGLVEFVERLLTESELSAKLMDVVCNDVDAEGFWNYVIVKGDMKHIK